MLFKIILLVVHLYGGIINPYLKKKNLINELNNAKFETGVFLTVGSLEREHMVVGANELSERLLQVNHDKLKFKFYEAEGENHASVVPTSLSKGLRFISYI